MELIKRDLILSLDDIRSLHAGTLLPIPRDARVLVSEVWLNTMVALEGEAWERARDQFNAVPRGEDDDPAGD